MARLVEYRIEMPSTVPAGPRKFLVTNAGSVEHNFAIEDLTLEESFEANLEPGQTMTMRLELTPGVYTLYCPVGDHRDLGMEAELTVIR